MSTVNPLSREISAKIVYYGPGLSGKTTSLQRVYDFVRPEARGQLISLNTEGDRTLFFDFLPVKVEQVHGLSLRLQLYTVPGQVFYDATRKLVLNGADGVVFVADSQAEATDRNLESMDNLRENLGELGIDLDAFPLVIQYNKRDLPGVLPVAELRKLLNPRGVPDFQTIAARGVNVMPALKEITRLVVMDLRARQPPARKRAEPIAARGSRGPDLAGRVSAAAGSGARPSTPWPPLRDLPPEPSPPPAPAAPAPRGAVSTPTPPPVRPARAEPPPPPPKAAPAPASPAAAPAAPRPPADVGTPLDLTFTRLFPGRAEAVAEVERAIRERTFGEAVRLSAAGLAEVLENLPSPDDQSAARAALLGIDGREYLRLSLLAAKPDPAVTEQDALFGLYLLVSSMLKAERL